MGKCKDVGNNKTVIDAFVRAGPKQQVCAVSLYTKISTDEKQFKCVCYLPGEEIASGCAVVWSIKAPPHLRRLKGRGADALGPDTRVHLQRSCEVFGSMFWWHKGDLHKIRQMVLKLWLIGVCIIESAAVLGSLFFNWISIIHILYIKRSRIFSEREQRTWTITLDVADHLKLTIMEKSMNLMSMRV